MEPKRHVRPAPEHLKAQVRLDDEAANAFQRSDDTHAIDAVWLAIGAGFGLFAVLLIALVLMP